MWYWNVCAGPGTSKLFGNDTTHALACMHDMLFDRNSKPKASRAHGYWIFVICAFTIFMPANRAFSWEMDKIADEPMNFIFGFGGSIVIHEALHWATASALGYDPVYDGFTIKYKADEPMSESDRLRISSAGILGQWLASEIAFHFGRNGPSDSDVNTFAAGIVVGEILTTAAYMTFLKDNEEGDVYGISEATGWSTDQVAALIAIPAILDTWRLLDSTQPKWLPVAAQVFKGAGIVFVWTY